MARRFLLTTRGPVALRPRIFHRFTTFSAMVLRRFACTMIASRWTRERARLERAPWKETSSWASKLTERGLKKGERERGKDVGREQRKDKETSEGKRWRDWARSGWKGSPWPGHLSVPLFHSSASLPRSFLWYYVYVISALGPLFWRVISQTLRLP